MEKERYKIGKEIKLLKKTIKCSQCDETFYSGAEYRRHFVPIHLKKWIKEEKKNEKQ